MRGSARSATTIARSALGAALVLLASPLTYGADDLPPAGSSAPSTIKTGYSRYEQETITLTLKERGVVLEELAEGKLIESIEIVRLDVIDRESRPLQRLPVVGGAFNPKLLNSLHVLTKERIVQRELMFKVGEPFSQTLLDETTRNLRRLKQLSLVLGVAIRGTSPDRVRVLILTKDIWSLRLAYDMDLGPGGIESLVIQPSEINLGGSHHTVSGQFGLTPATYSLGASYSVPRFGASYVGAAAQAGLIFNREHGGPEGSNGALAISQPLYTTLRPWAWGASGDWSSSVVRRFVNAQLATYDAEATEGDDRIPFEYRSRRTQVSSSVTRSFGWAKKTDLSLGWSVNHRTFATFEREGIAPEALAEFQRRFVPTSDTRSAPFAQLRLYTTNFHRVTDVETLALQEDIRLGHDITVQLYPVTQAFGSSRDYVGNLLSAQYTAALGSGFVRVGARADTEGTPDALTDASVQGSLRIVTPKLPLGRFVLDLAAMNRYRNYLNTQSYLGGGTRLRGFPSNYLLGKDYVVGNLEFRTRPVNLLSVQTGLVAFFDVGDAARSWEQLSPKQAAGLGVRALIPQLNRVVFRADIGFPLIRPLPPGVSVASFFLSFEQAFDLSNIGPS